MDTSPNTPTSSKRRLASEAATSAMSPAKKLSNPGVVPEPARDRAPLQAAEITHELHKLYLQSTADREFFGKTVESLNDHAQRLDLAWTLLSRVQAKVQSLDDSVEKNALLAVSNDRTVKQGLAEMETIINRHGEEIKAIPVLRGDVQGAVRDLAAIVEKQSSTGVAPSPADALGQQRESRAPEVAEALRKAEERMQKLEQQYDILRGHAETA